LRTQVPLDGTAPDDVTRDIQFGHEEKSWFEGSNNVNTFTLDSFLYPPEEKKLLIDKGTLLPYYCPDCRRPRLKLRCKTCTNRSVIERTHISSSLSHRQSRDIFTLLKTGGYHLQGKVVLDVGSRLGSNLFTGALFSEAKLVVGVEMEAFFAELSARTACFAGLGHRIQVICADIRSQAQRLHEADCVVFFNPFELHWDRIQHRGLLDFMRATVTKPGTRLVTVPSCEEIFQRADSTVDVAAWLTPLDHIDDAFVYRVR
jgi:predicted RNA methylase